MAKKKKKKNAVKSIDHFAVLFYDTLNIIVSFFILVLFSVFSLRYDNYYYNILETKTFFFRQCAGGMLVISAAAIVVFSMIDTVKYNDVHIISVLKNFLPRHWRSTFSISDVAVLLYLLVNTISTLLSDYPLEAFWGTNGDNSGRYNGLLQNLFYLSTYFLITRFWKMKDWFLEVFLANGLLVCLLGITDYFQLDLLNFRVKIDPSQARTFMSTIGNINTYTAYIALVLGFSAGMFLEEKNTRKKIWYFFCMIISFFSIIMGESDNAYLTLGALFAFTPLYLFRKKEGILKYLIMLASFFTVIFCIDLVNRTFPNNVVGVQGLFMVIAVSKYLAVLVCLLWLVVGAVIFWKINHIEHWATQTIYPFFAWCGVLFSGFIAVVFSFYDVNVLGHSERYGLLKGYLLFNESWGTNRGYVWRKTLETFHDFSLKRKLFGYGPDTFGLLSDNFYEEMVQVTGQVFDSVHNEYLQFLLTIGILGLLFYLVFIVSAEIKLFKAGNADLYVRGIFWAVTCYLFQAIVNINLPVVTPMLWLLLSCGMAACRKNRA